MQELSYFAYGSNLFSARLRARVPGCLPLHAARLDGFELCFHKAGMDGSGKCNALPVSHRKSAVHGMVWSFPRQEKPQLDAAEGLGRGYREAGIEVCLANGTRLTAFTYLATHIDGRLRPFDWYLEHVLAGAREWDLPPAYTRGISITPAVPDPDHERAAREWSLHRGQAEAGRGPASGS